MNNAEIKPKIPGMEPEELAGKHKGQICFCGGIDMQHLLPFGTPEEIQQEVKYRKTIVRQYLRIKK